MIVLCSIPGCQEHLLSAMADLGKPVVMVVMNGGPVTCLNCTWKMAAILDAFYSGQVCIQCKWANWYIDHKVKRDHLITMRFYDHDLLLSTSAMVCSGSLKRRSTKPCHWQKVAYSIRSTSKQSRERGQAVMKSRRTLFMFSLQQALSEKAIRRTALFFLIQTFLFSRLLFSQAHKPLWRHCLAGTIRQDGCLIPFRSHWTR